MGQYHMGIINKLFRSYSSIGYHKGITNEYPCDTQCGYHVNTRCDTQYGYHVNTQCDTPYGYHVNYAGYQMGIINKLFRLSWVSHGH
jgi:hypothetical protein